MELKPTKNYKMSKQTKRGLALIIDPHERGIQKRIMIQAELAAQQQPAKRDRKDKK
jgi:3-phenylpropionate/cinnamic acid dioxygenase small subunit